MAYSLNWQAFAQTNEATHKPTWEQLKQEFINDNPKIVAIDTETTGLNIVKDKPFLFIIAWKVNHTNAGKVFVLDYEPNEVAQVLKLFATCEYIIGANIKYDLHMLRNGGSEFPFEILNDKCSLTDVRILRRLTMEADANSQDERMALKQMACKFIDANANVNEMNIKDLLKQINTTNRKVLKSMLTPLGYTPKDVEETISDCRFGIETLPLNIQAIYLSWQQNYGEATYYDVYKQHPFAMNAYAIYDGIYTIEVFLYLFHAYDIENQKSNNTLQNIFNQENKLIRLYYNQEKIGLKVDLDYLRQSKQRVNTHLRILESELHRLLGAEISENQHKELLAIFKNKFKVNSEIFLKLDKKEKIASGETKYKETFDKNVLKKLIALGGEAGETALFITKLRRVRKWLSTYIDGIYKEVLENRDGRFHPQSNQVGAVSGRITSNMQQMPKDALLDLDGNELFHPRKIVIPSGNDYPFLVLQDFDQMELRVQAHYTIQFNCTDRNMCKIFIPLECRNKNNYELFDFNNPNHIQHYLDKDENGDSVWIDCITNQPWVPIDPHGMHVVSAFGYDKSHPDFKHLRSAAKTINFAVNYGSGLKGLLENDLLEEYPKETIEKIYNAYKANFKGVTKYQQIVDSQIKRFGKIPNIYGRVYKLNNTNQGYKCANYLVQGSCADLVKNCLIKIDEFLTTNNLKSRMLYTIHDEIIWELHKDEGWIISYIENILNSTSSWCKIPLTCGTDLTHTNWAEKKDISNYIGGE